jgi:predicted nucleic acid-binding protein
VAIPSYFDTSALVKLYVSEAHSIAARREAAQAGHLVFTPLQSLELHSAIRQLVGRGTLPTTALPLFENHFEADRRSRRVQETAVDLAAVFRRADQLTRQHTERLLCRTLDVLHVATAVELNCLRFVSADDRQLSLANAVGLTTIDIKR